MKHERLKVLEMLESGKITAEEATKLLEAMKGAGHDHEVHTFTLDEGNLNRFTQGVDNFAKDFGGKVENLYKDIEPKVKKASQAVLEKTAAVFDEIARSLNESLESARKTAEENHGEADCECGCDCGCEDEGPREN